MRPNLIISCLCSAVLCFAGCKKPEATAAHDACGLLTDPEIEAVVGSPIQERKSSGSADQGLRVAQCFYTAVDFTKSVSLAVTQKDPNVKSGRGPNEFWEELFGRFETAKKEGRGEKEDEDARKKKESLSEQKKGGGEEEEARPPKTVSAVGDQAFWSGNRVGGALYVLKKGKDVFIRISVGGSDNEEKKIEKSKALAQKALDRL